MIPYYEIPVYHLGPIPLDPWGVLVCIGFVVGMEVARAYGIRAGLDVRDVIDGIVAIVLMGFVGAHWVDVFAYHPEKLRDEGILTLLYITSGVSSFGGFIGAVVGAALFYGVLRRRPFLPHADAVMYGFPFGWFFGRLGCFSVHDHIGRETDFFLGVRFPGGTRFDLGLLEALWALVIAITFWGLGRRVRPAGTFLATWCLMYAPVRFGLDFLRNTDLQRSDVRWSGLTPAQWGCFLLFGVGLWLLALVRRRSAAAAG